MNLILIVYIFVSRVLSEKICGWWKPFPITSWQLQRHGTLDLSKEVQVYDVDLWDVSSEMIQQLHRGGRVVICSFSAGHYENLRSDASSFSASLQSKQLRDSLQMWIDISQLGSNESPLRNIMKARLELAKAKGCDAVEPEHVDAFSNAVRRVLEVHSNGTKTYGKIGRAVQQECRDRSRMPSSA
eukprot:TRINITY_DN95155_c0_g1_i2.p1 TRINITY_DN95155_c0_g1~~TRINITY_DN95155_c0_g1_i2.p1  ORF type:complete len:185 (-),score=31.72 TRINITY_DN95155_c0_g1_i2:23-577(-)